VKDTSETDLLPEVDGLTSLVDGPGTDAQAVTSLPPLQKGKLPASVRLWVVRSDDVVHAEEACAFGASRSAKKLKHTNLTGGEPAFTAGELLFLENGALLLTGDSGRYGARNANEMRDVAIAFRNSGYTVYSLGYDDEADRAAPLISGAPTLV
jgi:hypothetical protein